MELGLLTGLLLASGIVFVQNLEDTQASAFVRVVCYFTGLPSAFGIAGYFLT